MTTTEDKVAYTDTLQETQIEKHVPVLTDNEQLTQLGYTAELDRNFSIVSLISLGFVVCSSWAAAQSTMAIGLPQGGLVTIFWGFLIVTIFLGASALTLAEMASAFPLAGGQYQYVHELCPPRFARSLSFFTAWMSTFAWLVSTCSVLLLSAKSIMALAVLCDPQILVKNWHVFIIYQGLNIFGVILVGWGSTLMPLASKAGTILSFVSFIIFFVVIPIRSPYKNDASFIFTEFTNQTGWNSAICFLTGLANPAYMFAGIDSVIHMAEEIPNPRKNIPRALIAVVLTGLCTSLPYLIVVGFYFPPIELLLSDPTGFPSTALARLTFRMDGFVIALMAATTTLSVFILASVQLVTSRTIYSLARDGAIPYHKYFSVVWKKHSTPFRATLLQGVACAIIGCLYMGSSTAFNSIIAATITFFQLSYAIPALVLLCGGRKRLEKARGPFYLGGVVGSICAGMTVFWGLVYLVFFCFPYYLPATAMSMNYTSAVVGVLLLLSIGSWVFHGHKHYHGPNLVLH